MFLVSFTIRYIVHMTLYYIFTS